MIYTTDEQKYWLDCFFDPKEPQKDIVFDEAFDVEDMTPFQTLIRNWKYEPNDIFLYFDTIHKIRSSVLNNITKKEQSPLHDLINYEHPRALEIIDKMFSTDKITDKYVKNKKGETFIHLSASRGLYKLLEIIDDKYGLDGNIRDNTMKTPLHHSAMRRNIDKGAKTVKVLIEALESDPNIQDEDGNTPLHWAIMQENKKAIGALIPYTDLNIENDDFQKPIDLAKELKLNVAVKIIQDFQKKRKEKQNSSSIISLIKKIENNIETLFGAKKTDVSHSIYNNGIK